MAFAMLAAYHALFPVPAAMVFTRFLGLAGFMVLCVALMLGPLSAISPATFGPLLMHRRAVGIAAFALVLAHFLVSFSLELGGNVGYVLAQAPLQLGAVAFAILTVLALISNDWAFRNVPSWKGIQRLAYIAFVLSFGHFLLKASGMFVAVAGGKVFANAAELAMVALGMATILLQLVGFYIMGKRKSAKAAHAATEAQQGKTL
ncbi:MAG: ferric reductase-like transmembrane domain-containing protein [Candidatus Micrarchaeia archaeon]